MSTDRWGIDNGYQDALGHWRSTSDRTRRALVSAMGVDPDTAGRPEAEDQVIVAQPSAAPRGPARGDLVLEDGREMPIDRVLPADLPLGYHELRRADGQRVTVIVPPVRCHEPPRPTWGWTAQVYAVRSSASWGIGDFVDLRTLGRWSASLGATVLVVNPLHAAVPRDREDPSPYAPSSRRYRNPIYLRIEEIPGASGLERDLDTLRARGLALNAERRIDRDAVGRMKREALERLWPRFDGDRDFDRYVAAEGRALHMFAVFSALAEHHRRGWREWPAEHRRPDAPGVARFAAERITRVRFHQWLQWLLDRQLASAAREIHLVHDFPVGVDADGADAWAWQDVLATGASVGAPPDRYTAHGQDWGLPPFVPHRLRAARYEPLVDTLRAAMRHGGGLRIDHVMGLFRLFWVPRGMAPAEGAYVRYLPEELLAILALESHRARAFVVGEDLGTVERGVRERLAERGVLSTRVLWFERDAPERWPAQALAAVSTHDLPTIAGVWSGSDLAAQERLGMRPNAEAWADNRARLAAISGAGDTATVERVIEGTYRALAGAPCVVLSATLDDALAIEERPNMPGTTSEWPSWCLALPVPLDELPRARLPREIARVLGARHARGPHP